MANPAWAPSEPTSPPPRRLTRLGALTRRSPARPTRSRAPTRVECRGALVATHDVGTNLLHVGEMLAHPGHGVSRWR